MWVGFLGCELIYIILCVLNFWGVLYLGYFLKILYMGVV